ncbi:hypothetical protein HJC23_013107 [Cyclotella cryptica]|uniref:Sulfotransferase domain-containing protein n=1 Tax=Cyclotella cryptica TaxID=29204 RepID=A0ABD3QN32_9STRA|eukprot:CCRYP_003908-RA/>CCRYP_003908-RA protein AED:0.14 eAED:0.14 QI:0/-1/0/1/-1/1/1/0/569
MPSKRSKSRAERGSRSADGKSRFQTGNHDFNRAPRQSQQPQHETDLEINETYYISTYILRRFRPIEAMGSVMDKLTSYVSKIDMTKFGLSILITLAITLMQYGTQQQTNETIVSKGHSNRGNIPLKNSGSLPFNEKGYQARSQVPIPIEYSHFVELSEFADAVKFMRIHRENQSQQHQQQEHIRNRHLTRRLDEHNNTDLKVSAQDGEDDGKVDKTQNTIDASLGQSKGKDSMQIQQMHSSMPLVKHIPFFWHIPRSGGTTLTTLLGKCLGLVQAASSYSSPAVYTRWEDQELTSRFRDPTLYVVHMKKQQFVNVDLNDFQGVVRAANGNLISSELADLVVVQDVSLGTFLFEENDNTGSKNKGIYKGVLFAMFRHPIDRAVSVFYSKQHVHDVHFDPTLAIYSLTDWVNSPSYVNDYMVRSLVGKLNERSPQNQPPLNRNDLDVAKEILRRKCLVGLIDEKSESFKRFEKFFGWNAEVRRDSLVLFGGEDTAQRAQADKWRKEIVKDEECEDRLLHYNWEKKHKHPTPEEDELPFRLLEAKNRYDLELYIYARQLFDEQYLQLGFDDD